MEERIDGWKKGWMDGRVDGRKKGWIEEKKAKEGQGDNGKVRGKGGES